MPPSSSSSSTPPVVGIFVGGASSRMGGHPKGLLRAPDGRPIVERWRALCESLSLPCVLVGDAAAYADLGLDVIADARTGRGPLGGLVALLAARPETHAVAVACDMPYVTATLLARVAGDDDEGAAVLAPFADRLYQPLFARYERARVLPLAERQLDEGDTSLQKLIRTAGAHPLPLSADERRLLADWDEPADTGRA